MKLCTYFSSLMLCMSLATSQAKLGGRRLRHPKSGKDDESFELSEGQCEICSKENKNKPDSITIEYVVQGEDSQFQDSNFASCGAGVFPSSTTIFMTNKNGEDQVFDVVGGSNFTIEGPFNAETVFSFSNDSECYFHTSCSAPLVGGDQLGPFKILGGNDCNVGEVVPNLFLDTTIPGEQCEICSQDNKNKPNKLTLQYQSNGKNSQYQDSSYATCIGKTYPTAATIETTNKEGTAQSFDVTDGSVFEIDGPFRAETDFFFSDGNDCFMHTSCSVPLVAGDQIGPFIVLMGNECVFETPAPSTTPSNAPSKEPSSGPSFSPTSPPTPSPSASPSANPTVAPSTAPTASPSSSPSSSPTASPSTNPTNAPSTEPTASPSSSPSSSPTASPSVNPTIAHSTVPTATPSSRPSSTPTTSPSTSPTIAHSTVPSTTPSSSPSSKPTTSPSTSPTIAHSNVPSATPSSSPSSKPTTSPSINPTITHSTLPTASPSKSPSSTPTTSPSMQPSSAPSDGPSESPSVSPTRAPCIAVDKAAYSCGSPIELSFNFNDTPEDPLKDDWIGIYPCDSTEYFHAEIWQWSCGTSPELCAAAASTGDVVFDSLPSYNAFNIVHKWPVAPFLRPDGSVNRCFKAVILRNDGPSVPPYVQICESEAFEITETSDCPVRTDHYSNI